MFKLINKLYRLKFPVQSQGFILRSTIQLSDVKPLLTLHPVTFPVISKP